jgi:hypothetical protein
VAAMSAADRRRFYAGRDGGGLGGGEQRAQLGLAAEQGTVE